MNILSKIKTRKELASILEVPLNNLTYILYGLHGGDRDKLYDVFTIKKKNGGERIIEAPKPGLKFIQRRLNIILRDVYAIRSPVYGLNKGKSFVEAAKVHARKRFVFNIDIHDFYPSISAGRVYGMLTHMPYSMAEEVAATIVQLATYKGRLPQGAPSSPIISNMICAGLDWELSKLARMEKCSFTRYADDISFSTNLKKFPRRICVQGDKDVSPGEELIELVEANGFIINNDKTRFNDSRSRQRVLGLTVNKKTNVRRHYINQIRGMIHACRKFGIQRASDHFFNEHANANRTYSNKDILSVIRGRIEHVGNVKGRNDSTYITLKRKYYEIPEAPQRKGDYQATRFILSKDDAVLFTEGSTDWKHIEAAHTHFRKENKFIDLNFTMYKMGSEEPAGADALIDKCKYFSQMHDGQNKVLFLFDSDDNKAVKFAKGNDGSGLKYCGNNVFAALLPAPDFRKNEPICIEHLYHDWDLLAGYDERRFYFNFEFRPSEKNAYHKDLDNVAYGIVPRDGTSKKGWRSKVNSESSLILSDNVCDISKSPPKSLALSKNDFAIAVHGNRMPEIDFNGFMPLFEMLMSLFNR